MKRLSNLITSEIQRKNNRAISNDLNNIDPSILTINILPTKLSKVNFSQGLNNPKVKMNNNCLNHYDELKLLNGDPKRDVMDKHLNFTFEGQTPKILMNQSMEKRNTLAIYLFIKGFFDFLRANDSKRLTTYNYSHNEAKVDNEAPETKDAENNTKEDKIKDEKMEDTGHNKMEYEKLVGNTKLDAAKITTIKINIVFYSLPNSLLSPIIFPVYVIQVAQSYVTHML